MPVDRGLYDFNAFELIVDTLAHREHHQMHALPLLEVIKNCIDRSLTEAEVLSKSDIPEVQKRGQAFRVCSGDYFLPIRRERIRPTGDRFNLLTSD